MAENSQAQTKTITASGRAREARAGSAGQDAGASKEVLTKESLRKIGEGLNGRHWQTDIASRLGDSKSQMSRYLKGDRQLSPLLPRHLQFILNQRIEEIAALLNTPGMPYAGTPEAQEVEETIRAALDKIPGSRPPRKRSGATIA